MPVLFAFLTLLTGLTLPVLPLLPAFLPRTGLLSLRAGHSRGVRWLQVGLIWLFALLSLIFEITGWGWLALGLAAWFSLLAARLFPQNIFVALTHPGRAQKGLSDNAVVLACEQGGEVVAYPLEVLVPHHIINDRIGGTPALAAW